MESGPREAVTPDHDNAILRPFATAYSQSYQNQNAWPKQMRANAKIGKSLTDAGITSQAALHAWLDQMEDDIHLDLNDFEADSDALKLLPARISRLNKVIPLDVVGDKLFIAISYPYEQRLIDEISMASGFQVIALPAYEHQIGIALKKIMARDLRPQIDKILQEFMQGDSAASQGEPRMAGSSIKEDAPVIRLINSILSQAVLEECSDIHIDIAAQQVRVRFRIDGKLNDFLVFPRQFHPVMASRIKVMAGLDIAEKRIPQDGRFRLSVLDREVDFRVATLPTTGGEKVVIRILDKTNVLMGLEHLGLSQTNLDLLKRSLQRPHGLLLVTGSTGSGKTTTLYNILGTMDWKANNIVTLEDPVEYSMPGINQVQVNTKAGLTFAEGLGSILRQDPDIIMLGEIRDYRTARLAVQASLTGHLVLSTLHTNTAASTVVRLLDLGIEKFLLSNCLAGVISQRLVRRLCIHCRNRFQLDSKTAQELGLESESGGYYFKPVGCKLCGYSGYQGRIAIQEVMHVGPLTSAAIYRGASDDDIGRSARKEGMVSIKKDGVNKAKEGWTSLEEVLKIALTEN
ncbi:MAG: GspE/PulE family protein [Syntrophomonadaceae bacterium]